jgi:hypothetical protein
MLPICKHFFLLSAFQVFTPHGKEGEVEVKVKLAGYNQKVLEAAKITDAVSCLTCLTSFTCFTDLIVLPV